MDFLRFPPPPQTRVAAVADGTHTCVLLASSRTAISLVMPTEGAACVLYELQAALPARAPASNRPRPPSSTNWRALVARLRAGRATHGDAENVAALLTYLGVPP